MGFFLRSPQIKESNARLMLSAGFVNVKQVMGSLQATINQLDAAPGAVLRSRLQVLFYCIYLDCQAHDTLHYFYLLCISSLTAVLAHGTPFLCASRQPTR